MFVVGLVVTGVLLLILLVLLLARHFGAMRSFRLVLTPAVGLRVFDGRTVPSGDLKEVAAQAQAGEEAAPGGLLMGHAADAAVHGIHVGRPAGRSWAMRTGTRRGPCHGSLRTTMTGTTPRSCAAWTTRTSPAPTPGRPSGRSR